MSRHTKAQPAGSSSIANGNGPAYNEDRNSITGGKGNIKVSSGFIYSMGKLQFGKSARAHKPRDEKASDRLEDRNTTSEETGDDHAMDNRSIDGVPIARNRHKTSSVDTAIFVPKPIALHPSQNSNLYNSAAQDFQDQQPSRSPRPLSVNYSIPRGATPVLQSDAPTMSSFYETDDGMQKNGQKQIPASARTSSSNPVTSQQGTSMPTAFELSAPSSPDIMTDNKNRPGYRGSGAFSSYSQDSQTNSMHALPALQTRGPDNGDAQYLEPLLEDDPASFDLVEPVQAQEEVGVYAMEKRAELMLGKEHLHVIFETPKLLQRFTSFLNAHRPRSIVILVYYLDALKALRAIRYANAIAQALEPLHDHPFTSTLAEPTQNRDMEDKAERAFEVLVREDLPAFVAWTWIQVVSVSIQRRITGTLAPHLREASEGLAEVFCLSDPSRPDNPIVFASEEFTRTTQYGMNYAIGRNCRFLQGPRTNPNSVRRLAEACVAGREHNEVFVNYRRDGSPFMNLLMIAPLMDSKGNVRYFIGAQVDVSGLLKTCSELEGLMKLVERDEQHGGRNDDDDKENRPDDDQDEFQKLIEMLNSSELETVRRHGGRMHRDYEDDSDVESASERRPRLRLNDSSPVEEERQRGSVDSNSVPPSLQEKVGGRLEGVYQNYLLIRPWPSLRILFTSPSLRVPGILQSPFLHRIGGSSRVRNDLASALAEGRGVTAKVRWLTRADEDGVGEGRVRWIHATPLLGFGGAVGVWMVILVDDEGSAPAGSTGRRYRQAPPVASTIGGKDWDGRASGRLNESRRMNNTYDVEGQRRGDSGSTQGGVGMVEREREFYGQHNRSASSLRGADGQVKHGNSAANDFAFNLQ